MKITIVWVLFTSFLVIECVHLGALKLDNLKHCCGLGTEYAKSGIECATIQPPVPGIDLKDQTLCVNSVKVCCRKENQVQNCKKGIEDANKGKCGSESGPRTDCCEACQLGLNTDKSAQSCDESLGLGSPYDDAFTTCCKDASNVPLNNGKSNLTSTTSDTTINEEPLKNEDGESSSQPPLENVCDIGDICAQICIPTVNSYRCDCNKGFSLMADKISCKPDKRQDTVKPIDRCAISNPCSHKCIDTGLAIKCDCEDGYKLASDKKTCNDIDECELNVHECTENEVCINDNGGYYCDDPNFSENDTEPPVPKTCPPGFKLDFDTLLCDDINECQFTIICPRPKTCVNTVGSFRCEGEDQPQCPPGFYYKDSIASCSDIDECILGENDCNKESQTCLNTKGNYTCIDKVSKKTCPPGFKKNPLTNNCDDIDECAENDDLCGINEDCINELGGHICQPKSTTQKKTYPTEKPQTKPKPSIKSTTPKTTTVTSPRTTSVTSTTTVKPCSRGYKSNRSNKCIDINECADKDTCDSTQICFNTPGSYICRCKDGFTKDFQTGACIDLNECQLGSHDCQPAERCDNTIGSYLCARITGCGTGYTLNYGNGLCEDDDECALGSHNCQTLGPNYKCRNTLGSYRCEAIAPKPKPTQYLTYPVTPTTVIPSSTTQKVIWGIAKSCLPGYIMNRNGNCEDINECESNPCKKGQKCLNFNGRYQCVSEMLCVAGYEVDESGQRCVDVDECSKGTHKCSATQICRNRVGFYTCDCPTGFLAHSISRQCVDIDECKYHYICGTNAKCTNTIGSYFCECANGFREVGKNCVDIDECSMNQQLCEQNCINIWGSYRCSCKPGFVLNFDNRTCTDIDECEEFKDRKLCVGHCENVPGSYKCRCPAGYDIGSDGRTCRDIDECKFNPCPRHDDICLNTQGNYKCYSNICPKNYFRDPQHKSRCKKPQNLCDARDIACLETPDQYTYHYITIVSNFPVDKNGSTFFQINARPTQSIYSEFSMKIINVKSPPNVERANEEYFRMVKRNAYRMDLYWMKPIQGPQEIQIRIDARIYQGAILVGTSVTHLFLVVSEFPF